VAAMKPHGGAGSVSTLTSLPRPYGRKRARFGRSLNPQATIRQRHRLRQRPPQCRGLPMTPEIAKRNQLSRPSVTTFRQIEANRRNARKSTGPVTEEGKQRSRCNAVRHGLTAETVIGALEDAEDYRAFEAAIVADYDTQSAVERELVLRLASLLWRLRRATTMETGLFEMQADQLREFRQTRQVHPDSRKIVYAMFAPADAVDTEPDRASHGVTTGAETVPGSKPKPAGPADLARCFLRLANLPNFALDRLSRYEATLWRQVGQILFALDALDRRKPQDRGRRFGIGSATTGRATGIIIE